jgi:hypothetical protein
MEYVSFLDYNKHVIASATTFWYNNEAPWQILKDSVVTRQRGFKKLSIYMEAY